MKMSDRVMGAVFLRESRQMLERRLKKRLYIFQISKKGV